MKTEASPKPWPPAPRWTQWGRYGSTKRFPRMKRWLDLLLLLMAAPLWLPVTALVAIWVRLRLGSPFLFAQKRPGLGGQTFQMLKFRSMTDERDAEGVLLPDSRRLGAFGKRLRASSLDELPELFSVLRGEMSLVGPRPLLVQYLGLYDAEQSRRHDMPPGLTGWAQVHGRNALSWDEKFRLDCWYVDHASVALDIWILLLTIRRVMVRDGISAPGDATMPAFTGNRVARGDF
jgi:sugar transferase EpsL